MKRTNARKVFAKTAVLALAVILTAQGFLPLGTRADEEAGDPSAESGAPVATGGLDTGLENGENSENSDAPNGDSRGGILPPAAGDSRGGILPPAEDADGSSGDGGVVPTDDETGPTDGETSPTDGETGSTDGKIGSTDGETGSADDGRGGILPPADSDEALTMEPSDEPAQPAKKKSGIGPQDAGTVEVSTWDAFKAAYENSAITTIRFKSNIQYTGTKNDGDDGLLAGRTTALTIDGQGYTLDFGSQVGKGLILGDVGNVNPPVEFAVKNLYVKKYNFSDGDSDNNKASHFIIHRNVHRTTLVNSTTETNTYGWNITLENVSSTGDGRAPLVNVPNSILN
ncbi:MAG: hypothetical protein LBR00_01680, partial [Clostridiales Family XIII bacterium]|nr:hypothetical protein [Clostridiales Family XIII bacterium]